MFITVFNVIYSLNRQKLVCFCLSSSLFIISLTFLNQGENTTILGNSAMRQAENHLIAQQTHSQAIGQWGRSTYANLALTTSGIMLGIVSTPSHSTSSGQSQSVVTDSKLGFRLNRIREYYQKRLKKSVEKGQEEIIQQ